MKFFIIFVLTMGMACTASATTWYVAADGSTDYLTIQSAVNVAASGDTVRIGPGVYSKVHNPPEPNQFETAIVSIPHDELTLIGAGQNETFIGQEHPWVYGNGWVRDIHGGNEMGNSKLTIDGICVQNAYQGVFIWGGGHLIVTNCRFRGSEHSVALYSLEPTLGDVAVIEDCYFESAADLIDMFHIWNANHDSLVVRNNLFELREVGGTTHIVSEGRETIIENCDFYQGRVAIGIVSDGVTIRDCLFLGQGFYGIKAQIGEIVVEDCVFRDQLIAFYTNNYNGGVKWEIQRVIVESASLATLYYHSLGPGFIKDCTLAKGEQFVVRSYHVNKSDAPLTHFDMTNNWWGTSDPDSIQAWIYDGVDDPTIGGIIDWEPFKSELVGTEKTTLGGFRSMFR